MQQDGLRKLVEDVRQPISKAVSFMNRSHAATAPAKAFNAFEYSDKNLDKAGVNVAAMKKQAEQQKEQMQQQMLHKMFYGSQPGVGGGARLVGGYGSLSASISSQNYHPNVEVVPATTAGLYRSGGNGGEMQVLRNSFAELSSEKQPLA